MVSRSDRLGDLPIADGPLLEGLGMESVEDLLRHYPRRHYDRGEVADLGGLRVGDYVTVQVQLAGIARIKARQRMLTKLTLTDGRRRIAATFFNDRYLHRTLQVGSTLVVAGTVAEYRGAKQFTHPEVATTDPDDHLDGTLAAVYPATKKVPSWRIRRAVRQVLPLVDWGEDPLPLEVRARQGLADESQALQWIHRPPDRDSLAKAERRLRFDEAFLVQLTLARRRADARAVPATPRPRRAGGLLDAFDARLPFALTPGQQSVGDEVFCELDSAVPMHRLLQGEVGSGKTVVALRAMLAVIDAGGQTALLAPTEVLAQQHARSIAALLGPLAEAGRLGSAEVATRVALITGSLPAARRRQELLDAASGAAGIVVGTHALLEDQVQFADLGLVVVDEQHRFGVEQRDTLRGKAHTPPHLLVLTATPIPRTVAMTVYGDLEVSTLRDLPPGRSPISTAVVALPDHPEWLDRVWQRVREEVDQGHRAYIVCPRIDPGPESAAPGIEDAADDGWDDVPADGLWEGSAARPPAAAVTAVAEQLTAGPLAGLRVAILHGRLAPETKDEVMRAFGAGDVDVLVATTVVEVGVDVPDASVMVVLDADRFGISQLHQLRGRVGRGAVPGLCLLVTAAPADTPARRRVDGVAATTDGFALAQLDLEQRREGDVLGERQSGRRSSLRLLRLLRDEEVIVSAREDAADLIAADPRLAGHPRLAAAVDALVGEGRADYLAKA